MDVDDDHENFSEGFRQRYTTTSDDLEVVMDGAATIYYECIC